MFKRILVAIDGSDAARAALGESIELARRIQARVRILHVINQMPWSGSTVSGEVLQGLMDGLRGTGESLLHEALRSARAAGIDADTRLVEAPGADAGEYVTKAAGAWGADLIVCGTHGRRGLRRAVIGGDAEYIVRHCAVPVLVVRAACETDRA